MRGSMHQHAHSLCLQVNHHNCRLLMDLLDDAKQVLTAVVKQAVSGDTKYLAKRDIRRLIKVSEHCHLCIHIYCIIM